MIQPVPKNACYILAIREQMTIKIRMGGRDMFLHVRRSLRDQRLQGIRHTGLAVPPSPPIHLVGAVARNCLISLESSTVEQWTNKLQAAQMLDKSCFSLSERTRHDARVGLRQRGRRRSSASRRGGPIHVSCAGQTLTMGLRRFSSSECPQ